MVHPMKKSLAITAAAASPQAKVVFVVFAFNTSPASCPPFQGVSHLLSCAPSEVQCPIHPPGWLLPQVTPSSSSSPLMLEVPFFFFFWTCLNKNLHSQVLCCFWNWLQGFPSKGEWGWSRAFSPMARLRWAAAWGGFSMPRSPGPQVPRVHKPPLLWFALLPGSKILGPTFLSWVFREVKGLCHCLGESLVHELYFDSETMKEEAQKLLCH